MTDKNADTAFVSSGYSNWKKALQRFEQHAISKAHKEVVLKIVFLDQPSVTTMLHTQHERDQEIRRKMFMVVLSSLRYLLRQGQALRGHEEMEGNLMQLLLLRSSDHAELQSYIQEEKVQLMRLCC